MHSFVRRAAPLSLLPLLALVACGAPGERTGSSDDAVGVAVPIVFAVHATSTGSAVTVTYSRSIFSTPLTITLAGPTATTTLDESTVNGATGVVFSGLDECTPFTFTLSEGGTTVSTGHIHTMSPDGSHCGTTETIPPSRSEQFRGMYHWRNDASYCTWSSWSDAYRAYPETPWWSDGEWTNATGPIALQVGSAIHDDSGG